MSESGFRIRWGVLLAAFAVGIFIVYTTEPAFEVVPKFPTPFDCDRVVYHDLTGGCYMFKAEEVACDSSAESQPVGA
jgi:hypothetical protein